jgi:hypothetical protein
VNSLKAHSVLNFLESIKLKPTFLAIKKKANGPVINGKALPNQTKQSIKKSPLATRPQS